MEPYQIPALYCPFETVIDREREQKIEFHTNQFLQTFNLVNDFQFAMYKGQRFASMITRSYPLGSDEVLNTWCDLNTLLFLVDDDLDEKFEIVDRQSLAAFTDKFVEILVTNECPYTEGVYLAFFDFWRRIKPLSTNRWQSTFIQNVKDMWSGGSWQFEHLIAGTKPSLSEYLELRQYLGAAHLATDSLEITAEIPLSTEVFNDHRVIELTKLSRNAICFANDLFSLGKEVENSHSGAEFNLVTILSRERNMSINDAITEAAIIHDQYVNRFVRSAENIFNYDSSTNYLLEKYVKALGFLMKGNIEWSTQDTTRYPHIYMD